MANNRLVLICTVCNPTDEWHYNIDTKIDNVFAVAKYFPSTGWYTRRTNNESFNRWLEFHGHDREWPYRFDYEAPKRAKTTDGE